MSKLRKRIAEIQPTSDGKFVDTETGEILDKMPEDKSNQSWEQKMQNIMYDKKKSAQTDFTDVKYYNQWNKVSPLNIIMTDNINQLYGMDPKSAGDAIINIITQLNNTYGFEDKTYDYISQTYLNEMKMNLAKKKTIDQVVQYLTNMYFQGMGMGSSKKKRYASIDEYVAAVAVDVTSKTSIHRAMIALATVAKIMK